MVVEGVPFDWIWNVGFTHYYHMNVMRYFVYQIHENETLKYLTIEATGKCEIESS